MSRTHKKVLVTGGAGYIGSHTVLKLLAAGHLPVVFDNFSNAKPSVIKRLNELAGESIEVVEGDLRDTSALEGVFKQYSFDAVIHFAGLKAVGESQTMPIEYYQNNVAGSLNLFNAMRLANCHELVFSSSATVYGDPKVVPITESESLKATNPYGWTKLMVEQIARDIGVSNPHWNCALLRYFNPVGAHPSGLIGEDPLGIPNNLVPFIAQVAVGKRSALSIYGNDYPTPDGTGIRDYIHVEDLADAHVKALAALPSLGGTKAFNVGTGTGYSVLEVVAAFERASQQEIPYEIVARRAGDIAVCFADSSLTHSQLDWRAHYDLEDMLRDHWRWQKQNPMGYES